MVVNPFFMRNSASCSPTAARIFWNDRSPVERVIKAFFVFILLTFLITLKIVCRQSGISLSDPGGRDFHVRMRNFRDERNVATTMALYPRQPILTIIVKDKRHYHEMRCARNRLTSAFIIVARDTVALDLTVYFFSSGRRINNDNQLVRCTGGSC